MNDLLKHQNQETGPVECLGIKFPNDQDRREHFVKILAEKLTDPAFRKLDGFPTGTDEAILAMSDPPYYTACPNPFVKDFISFYQAQKQSNLPNAKEPFATDVSEGKVTPFMGRTPITRRCRQKQLLDISCTIRTQEILFLMDFQALV